MKLIALLIMSAVLAGCDAVDTMSEGFKHSLDVSSELEQALGSKPNVGFSWNNGRLTNVSVNFSEVPEGKSINDIIKLSRNSIGKYFKQKPGQITIAFSVTAEPD